MLKLSILQSYYPSNNIGTTFSIELPLSNNTTNEIEIEGKIITDYPRYFINGIVMQRQQRKTNKQRKDLEKIQMERSKRKKELKSEIDLDPMYNWLES